MCNTDRAEPFDKIAPTANTSSTSNQVFDQIALLTITVLAPVRCWAIHRFCSKQQQSNNYESSFLYKEASAWLTRCWVKTHPSHSLNPARQDAVEIVWSLIIKLGSGELPGQPSVKTKRVLLFHYSRSCTNISDKGTKWNLCCTNRNFLKYFYFEFLPCLHSWEFFCPFFDCTDICFL